MTKQNKLILGSIFILLLLLLSHKAKKYIIDKDYFVYMHIPCTSEYSCFEMAVDEDEEVEGEFSSTYWKMYRKAYVIESCIQTGECDPMMCSENEEECSIVTCSDETVEDGETCVLRE